MHHHTRLQILSTHLSKNLTNSLQSQTLTEERSQCTFNVGKLINLLDGGAENTKRKYFIRSPIEKKDYSYKYDLTRGDLIKEHVKEFIDIHKKFASYVPRKRIEICWMAESANFSGSLTNSYNYFLGAILPLADKEQLLWWVDKAKRFEIAGTYAQTELGHGSNIRALQTTAIYDKSTEEFIIDTPTLQSIKWWPGGLGRIATHACIYAQLIIDQKEYGIHPFIVQLRDENHIPLPGIELGDIGKKIGDNANDTGYLILNKIRIPRRHMLAKYQEVTQGGKYIEKKKFDKKLSYASMIFTRVIIIHTAYGKLAQATTIATRYSSVRKQGFKNTTKFNLSHLSEENQIIDYQIQQYRLFKQISIAYAMKATSNWLLSISDSIEKNGYQTISDTTNLKEFLAISAGLKALMTYLSYEGIEDCRKCCGGNGYLLNSGIGAIACDFMGFETAEGDYAILSLFTSKFLMKQFKNQIQKHQSEEGIMSYFNDLQDREFVKKLQFPFYKPAQNFQDFMHLEYLLELFKFRALKYIYIAQAQISHKIRHEKLNSDMAMNQSNLEMMLAARAHSFYIMFQCFFDFIHSIQNEPEIIFVLRNLCMLFGCSNIIDDNWQSILQKGQLQYVQQAIEELLLPLRVNAVGLVDAFDYPDSVLNSTIGKYDGNVYEALVKAAKNSSLNQIDPFRGYDESLKPYLNKDFLKIGNSNNISKI